MSKGRAKRQRKEKGLQKFAVAIVAVMLVVAMIIGLMPMNTNQVLAADYTADLGTVTKYKESLGDDASTEYAGRVWTDKSVYSDKEVKFDVYTSPEDLAAGKQNTQTVANDSDFLVSFSALATSQAISGQTQAPIDVVFIIDLSGSMSNQNSNMTNNAGQTYSRIKFTVDAVNKAIADLMELNPYTRVGVVGFNESGTTLLELDRYTKSGNNEYFSLSRNTGSNEYATLYTRAVNSSGDRITKDTSVSGGTNIQHGLYQGMSLLASEDSTTVTIDGKEVQRVPSVILLSDGAPTYSCEYEDWWAPVIEYETDRWGNSDYVDGSGVQGPGSSSYYGNGMLAMMTGAYMKAQIDGNYKVTGTAQATTIYTIGMGINDLATADRNLARVTLNPKTYLDSTNENYDANNAFATDIAAAWATYGQASNNTPDIVVNQTRQGGGQGGGQIVDVTYELTHPSSGDISGDALKNYVDLHYDADDADSIAEVFQNIVNNIAISTPEIPTEHDSENPLITGYITYTDPIGEYMEVKELKAILYAGQKFEAHSKVTEGNKTTYTFTETVEGNAVYDAQPLSSIIIEVVSEDADNDIVKQTLTVKIPAALIPIRVNTVELSANGSVKSHTNNGAYPIRVLYTVGLQDAVKQDEIVSLEKISDEYLAKHLNADGTIDFYSNLFTGTNVVNNHTAGDATVVFDAASTNPFYYMQKDTILYADEACTIKATGTLAADQTYYYSETYYHGNQIVTEVVARTGAQLTGNTTVVQHDDGYWYRPEGTVRVNRMLEFEGTKSANATKTAQDFYAPTYDGETGHFTVYLGNNGVMSVEATGTLEISKTVTAADGLTAPDVNFTFTVDLEGATGSYTYTVVDAEGNGVRQAAVTDGGTIVLKAGQTATIINLPPNTKYTVTETAVAGFTASAEKLEGTITAGTTVTAAFSNHYTVTPVTFPTNGSIQGKKVLEGRNWAENDAFTFFITATNEAPLPTGYDANAGVTVTNEDAADNEAVFDFGTITFTKPGLYRYTIVEKEPENDAYLAGMTYSRALYVLTVNVTDDGDGTLSYTSSVQRLYTDDATPLFTYDENGQLVMNPGEEAQDSIVFTNTYDAESVVRVPVAVKNYTDHSGNKPLQAGMFEFKLTPLGYLDADGNLVANTAGSNPMPLENGEKLASVITTNEGENITFPSVTFTHDDILSGDSTTYRYQMEEVLPAGATAENGYTVNGMTYDANKYVIDVTVSVAANSNVVNVNAVYPNDERIVTFVNSYDPEDVTLGKDDIAPIKGIKTLTGRAMLDGETFEFTLTAADDATAKAIADKVVLVTKDKATVSGGADGAAVGFDFGETTFTKPGTYTFNVAETKGIAGGVTYDEHVCTVTVVVTDNNGKLEAAVTYNNGADAADNSQAVFNNTYKATFDIETAIDLYGTKELTGRPIKAGDFYFAVEAQNGAPMGSKSVYVPAEEDAEANKDGVYEGAITFLQDVVYTAAGEYVYKIREVIPTNEAGEAADDGVTYDTTVYTVTVTVTDDLKGTLSAKITKIEKTANGTTTDVTGQSIVFVNTYEADEAEYVFRALQKILSGERKDALKAGEFEFVRTASPTDGIEFYKADDAATTDVDESLIRVGVTGEDIVANDANGIVHFGNIKFTKAGTYVVQIREVIPQDAVDNGITYDTHVVEGTFHVVDDLGGNLVATLTGIVGNPTFTNKYETTGTLVGEENLEVTKVLDVATRVPNTWTDDDKFTFVLEAGDEATKNAIANGTVVLPDNAEDTTVAAGTPSIIIGNPGSGYTNSKAFGDITFYAVGEYSFILREVAGTAPGMDYDATARIITVKTEDNGDGTLSVSLVQGSQTNPIFTNVYNIEDVVLPGHENLHVNKVFTGRPNDEWLDTDSFKFTLEVDAADEATVQAAADGFIEFAENGTTLTVTKDNKDHVHFGNITFSKAGTYKFVIKEVTEAIPGVTYDADSDRNVTVVVTSHVMEDGKTTYLTAAIDYNNSDEDAQAGNAFTFTNTYDTTEVTLKGNKVLEVTKVIDGRYWLAGDEFTFTLEAGDTATNSALAADTVVFKDDKDLTSMSVVIKYAEGDTNGSKSAMFDQITFYEPGTYSFLVKETGTDTATMQYDKHTDTIVVEVVDNGLGALEVREVGSLGNMTWTNKFTPVPVVVEKLEGIKRIEGRDMKDDDVFNFVISAMNDLARTAMPERTQVTNAIPENNVAAVTFGPLTFKTEGTYEYAISERPVSAHGITSDAGYVKATVVVTYDATTGKLTAGTPVYEKVNSEGTGFEFINHYSTEGILDGSTHLKVTKNFTGRANNAWLEGDRFEFTLATGDDQTAQAVKDGIVTLPENASGITISYADTQKEKAFGDIKFTKAGTYQFVVTETTPKGGYKDGITYDSDPERTIIVVVEDNKEGTLTATVDRDNGSELLVFTNKYDTTETTLIGADNLVVEKQIVGREWITNDTYSFTLKADMDHVLTAEAINAGSIVMPADGKDKVTITSETADHKAAFGNITFKEPGTFKFVITEDIPTEGKVPGMTYDSRTKHITVEVVDNHNGTMTATATVDNRDNLVFTNTYAAAPTSASLHGTKAMDGRDLHETDKFEFTISVADGSAANTPLPAETTVVNAADGTIAFAPIVYKEVGTYLYEIKEVIPADEDKIPGVEYAENTVTVKVEVTDNKLGHLVAAVTYGEGGFSFTNMYQGHPINVTVAGTKTVTASEGNSYTMKGGEFKFEIEAAESNPSSDPVTHGHVYNTADGKITFIDNLLYTEEGTYRYTVHEVGNNQPGITYDSSVYRITVEVVDNHDGTMSATASYTKDDVTVDEITFTNTYDPTHASALIHGHKVLVSEHKTELEAGLFTFTLTARNEMAKEAMLKQFEKESLSATNTAAGIFQFDALTYDKVGTYEYLITEEIGSVPGYIYNVGDKKSYEVTVTVTDDNNSGALQSSVSGVADADGNPIVVFTNGYVPEEVVLQGETALRGQKVLNGRELAAGEFTFVLLDAEGNTVYERTNDAEGNFTFEPLKFTKAGTYYYTIEEENNGLGGVTYDGSVYTVKIVVTDKGGYLAAEVTYLTDSATADKAVFTNTYGADSTSKALYAKKTLSGRGLNENEFSFVLKSGDTVLQRKQNNEEGVIVFDAISYDKAGEYEYTIAEEKGDKGGITYDTNTFTAIVKVTDNGKGQLESTVTYKDETGNEVKLATFENAYTPANTFITLEGKKVLEGRDLVEGEFTFLLKNEAGEVIERATNTADGKVTFERLTFSQVGTFIYTVVEDSSAAAEGIIYDDSEYKVVVKVTDNLEGSLVAEVINAPTITFNNQYTEPKVTAVKMQAVNDGTATTEPLDVLAGDVVTYTITLKNDGNAMARNIILKDTVPEGLELVVGSVEGGDVFEVAADGTITWRIYRLGVESEATVSFQVKVPTVKEEQTWKNIATYYYDNNPNNPEDSDEPKKEPTNEVDVTVLVPELDVVKVQKVNGETAPNEGQLVKAGNKVTYQITVTNIGTGEAKNVTLTDKVPEGLILDEESITGNGKAQDGTITWNITSIAVGEENAVTVEFTVTVPEVEKDTTWKNVATVVYDNNPENPEDPDEPKKPEDSNEVTITEEDPQTEVTAVKKQAVNDGKATEKPVDALAGDVVTYTITLTNEGDATARNIVLTDKVPEGLELVAGSVKGGDDFEVAEDGTITWTISRLKAGKDVTVEFQVTVPTVKEDTTWQNVATYVYDNNPNNPEQPENPDDPSQPDDPDQPGTPEEPKYTEETNEVEVTAVVPKLEVVKTQRVNFFDFPSKEQKKVEAGDKVTYYITVTNVGTGTAEGIVIADMVPEGLILNEDSISDNGTVENGLITWNIDSIEAGKEVTVEFAVTAPEVDEETTWKNIAIAVYDNNPENPEDSNEPKVPEESNEVTVTEEGKPAAPVTGDNASTTMWTVVALASLMTCVVTFVQRRRRNN